MDNLPNSDPRVIEIRKLWAKMQTTQLEAACQLNMSQSSISQYLNEVIPMNTDTVLKFAKFFEVPPDQIDPNLKF